MRNRWIMRAAAAAMMGLAAAPAIAQVRGEAGGADVTDNARTRGRAAVGEQLTGALGAEGDKDWYRVRLEAGETYRIGLSTADVGGASLTDPMVRVLDRSGAELAKDDDGGGNLNALVEFMPPARGDYFIEARGFGDDATGGYALSVRAGDIPATAETDAMLAVEGDSRSDKLAPAGDKDWYKVTLTDGQTVRVRLTSGEPNGLSDPLLVIYDHAGAEVARDDDGGGELNAYLEFTAPSAGDYFIEARGFGDDAEGAYGLQLINGEIGNNAEGAEAIAVDASHTSTINPADDSDWYSLELVEGRSYRFFVEAAEGAEFDPLLTLKNGEGQDIKADDDGGVGVNARLEYVSPATGTYFLAVSAYEGASSGGYTLRVSDHEVPGTGSDETIGADGDARESAVDFNGDKDRFTVALQAGTAYVITADGPETLPPSDPVVSVISADDHVLATDDDSGPGSNARLVFTPQQSGDFQVEVSGFAGSVGPYTLKVTPQ